MFITKYLSKILLIATALTSSLAAQAYEASDTNVIGQPLDGEHFIIDVSANGRYLLLANFDPDLGPQIEETRTCRIWRKDISSGDIRSGSLELAFESNQLFDYCARAKISANGRYVAAAPGQRFPADDDFCAAGGTKVQALQVKDLDTGDVRRVWKRWELSANDIARICLGSAVYLPQDIYAFSGNGNVAVIQSPTVYGNTYVLKYELLDAETGQKEILSPDGSDDPSVNTITSLALSHKGTRVALTVFNTGSLDGPSDVLLCGQVGRCDVIGTPDSSENSWWEWAYDASNQYDKQVVSTYQDRFPAADSCDSWWNCPEAAPTTVSLQIINRKLGSVRKPAGLQGLSRFSSLLNAGWSLNGKRLSWIEYPNRSFTQCTNANIGSGVEPVCTTSGCSAEECELTAHTYFPATRKLRSQTTDYDPETLSGCYEYAPEPFASNYLSSGIDCTAKLSRNGNYLLYARSVRYPFNDSWQPNPLAIKDFICVDRLSLETPNMVATEVACPDVYPDSGPIIGIHSYDQNTDYTNPVIWYVRDLRAKFTQVVSRMPRNNLFTSSRALMSANSKTLAFQTRDPIAVEDSRTLYTNCTWQPTLGDVIPLDPITLSLGTGDTIKTVPENDFVVYPATPAICPVPDPARESRVVSGHFRSSAP